MILYSINRLFFLECHKSPSSKLLIVILLMTTADKWIPPQSRPSNLLENHANLICLINSVETRGGGLIRISLCQDSLHPFCPSLTDTPFRFQTHVQLVFALVKPYIVLELAAWRLGNLIEYDRRKDAMATQRSALSPTQDHFMVKISPYNIDGFLDVSAKED